MYIRAEFLLIISFGASVYSNTVISGNVGEDVILPCIVEYKEEFSYNTVFIRWKTKDFYVLHFFYGHFHEDRQNKIFKGRTQLFYTELPKGNLSLILNNIQNSDAGIYECLVFISKDMYKMKTELVVQDKAYEYTNESSVLKASLGVLIASGLLGLTAFLRRKKRSRGRAGSHRE